jgi:putative SOS response-associated peptidase YedK
MDGDQGRQAALRIAMKDRSPFGIAGIWENWKNPAGEWLRTFAVLTTDANELVARIHGRMPAILKPSDYERWLEPEPDPHDLLEPFPSEPMTMWPISKRVNSSANDDQDLVTEIALNQQHDWQ